MVWCTIITVYFQGLLLISDCAAVMECRAHSVHTVGDHHVWYGDVVHAEISTQEYAEPLLYFTRYEFCKIQLLCTAGFVYTVLWLKILFNDTFVFKLPVYSNGT